ncbi:polysaccharide deacetylase family protein [Cellulosimicrobium protaetiae]|uniref:Polysaccharide deacetylase family protein n=1 Tax=Cellulosimicrobium protaetiae TaxID=2587808 RepID=A0A6M5UF95_9MICO|nr:polysaccharide deacetylase family protein [Cellulosimicrobium protaetiae]QJW35981.1 polysaccharide deacetylase family protein [Cellulosimicrobium protaetiae]
MSPRPSRPLLVRLRDVESASTTGGRFRDVAVARGLVPLVATSPLGTFCVDTDERVHAITYDDGPDPEQTPPILDVLARRGARATFFVLSDAVRRHPDVAARIVADGHELALHGADHRSLLTLSGREAVATVRRAKETVEEIVGTPLRLYRPPYGAHTLRQAVGLRRLGLDLVLWSGDAVDWLDGNETTIADRAAGSVFPGSILLLHDTRADPETIRPGERLPTFDRAAVLDLLLERTRAAGFREVTAGELVARHRRVASVARQRMVRP